MDQVFDAFEQIPVTENMIGQLHQDLLRYSTKDEELVEKGYLLPKGQGRGAHYVRPL